MIDFETIEQAARLIKDHILQTPLIYSPALSARFDARIFLKLENLQKTGSFKVRGATHKILLGLRRGAISAAGVVAASAGNHAQGVALAARQAGLAATIVMPQWASISKQEATRGYGGNIVIYGATLEESLSHAQAIAEQQGMAFIHPFDDPEIIAGQATVGLEIVNALPDLDTVLVPVGGGGLIAGVASAIKAIKPEAHIIGVEAAVCPKARVSLEAGKCVPVEAGSSIADGISVKQLGQTTFDIIRRHVDEVVGVPEEYIAAAIQILLERKRILAEGAGASPFAALLAGHVLHKGKTIVLLISGGNVDSPLLGRIIHQGLLKNGRIMRMRLTLSDKPGTLARLLGKIAGMQANILHIHHDRSVERQSIDETRVELELETRNHDHIGKITEALRAEGYTLESIHCSGP
jgi:threonine dehydratase